MIMVKNEELSALLDGELSADRAAQVRAAIATDHALSADFDALVRLDTGLAGLAAEAAFMPEIVLPSHSPTVSRWATGSAALGTLLVVRLLPKFADIALAGVLLQAAAAVAVLIALIALAHDDRSMAYRKA